MIIFFAIIIIILIS